MATIQFNLRVPEELKQKIDEASAKSGRSINAEATYRLEQSFNQPQNIALPDFVKQSLVDIINNQLTNAQKEIEDKVKALKNLDEKDVEEFIEYQMNKKPTL